MAEARFGGVVARGVTAVTDDAADLTDGFWVVVVTFEGELRAVRMAEVERLPPPVAPTERLPAPVAPVAPTERATPTAPLAPGPWAPLDRRWRSSLDRDAYVEGVEEIRRRIAAGTVYQVNLCRVLEHDLPEDASISALGAHLAAGNPAPYAATIDLPEAGLEVACASPEAFLVRRGDRLTTRPIKGTARTPEGLLAKDHAENVMIVDLVRHDLAPVSRPGTVEVDHLCRVEAHPGLVHLVSDVSGRLREGVGWPEILRATFPPGSVSGAPKHTALLAIRDLEPVPRGPYCGAVGWVDADRDEAELAVGIRTFWAARDDDGRRLLRFGTGAGITWGSVAVQEWDETELKAARLVGIASGAGVASGRV